MKNKKESEESERKGGGMEDEVVGLACALAGEK